MRRAMAWLGAATLAVVAGGGAMLVAGPLNPPGGPVAGTHKTLTEVEPRKAVNATNTPGDLNSTYRITQPGSYYLVGDVVGAAGDSGITIAASDVTLDLNGFAVRGVAGALTGITTDSGGRTNVTVHNGTVRDWPFSAVSLSGGGGATSVVEQVRAISNGGQNIVVGPNSRVTHCTVENAGSYGIYASGGRSVIESCTVRTAVSFGIIAIESSVIRGCIAENVSGAGIAGSGSCVISDCAVSYCVTGIYVELASTAEGCTAKTCSTDGFYVNLNSTVRGCTSANHGATSVANGIRVAGTDSRVEGNNVTGSDYGIRVTGGGNIIVRNTASGNTTANYDIAAGNFGLFVNAAPMAAGFSGAAGGTALGSTDPSVNFSY